MNRNAKRWALWATTILSLAAPAVAQAQEASDEIVVTARRRAELQQDVPLAVSALSAAQLERQGVTDVNSLQGTVPNLVISPGQGSGASTPVFAIRGLSQQDLTHLSDPSVSLYFNDMVIPRPIGGNIGFFDIANIQVARGPQGTLFGRNTPGGAVIVTPNTPGPEFGGSISQTIAEHGTYRTEAVINLPIDEALSLRVAGLHRESDGYISDRVTGDTINTIDEDAVRVGLSFDPVGRFATEFSVNFAQSDNGGTGMFAKPGFFGGAAQTAYDDYSTASGVPQHSDVDVFSIDNHTTWELNDKVTIRNILGYRELQNNTLEDVDGTNAIRGHIQRVTEQDQWSEEIQVLGEETWGDWIFGAFYFKETGDDQGISAGAGLTGVGAAAGDVTRDDLRNYTFYSNTWSQAENTSYAVFAQTTFELTSLNDGLSATIGVRQNWDDRSATILNRTSTACRFSRDLDNNAATPETPAASVGLAQCALNLEESFSEPTYNMSLDWEVTDDMLLYVATRHGYRTGGFGARASTEQGLRRAFLPETVNDIELGMKADWNIGGAFLRTNLAVFHAGYTDIQRLLQDSSTFPITTVTTNAGKATIDGVELEYVFRPVDWLEFSGFWSYTDADFTKFLQPTVPPVDLSVFPVARAPRNIGGATVRVDFPLGESIGDASVSLSYFHQDKYNMSDSFLSSAINWQESYDLFDLTAELDQPFGMNANLQVYVSNLFENEYTTGVLATGTSATSINSAYANEPRTVGMRLRYNFGG